MPRRLIQSICSRSTSTLTGLTIALTPDGDNDVRLLALDYAAPNLVDLGIYWGQVSADATRNSRALESLAASLRRCVALVSLRLIAHPEGAALKLVSAVPAELHSLETLANHMKATDVLDEYEAALALPSMAKVHEWGVRDPLLQCAGDQALAQRWTRLARVCGKRDMRLGVPWPDDQVRPSVKLWSPLLIARDSSGPGRYRRNGGGEDGGTVSWSRRGARRIMICTLPVARKRLSVCASAHSRDF